MIARAPAGTNSRRTAQPTTPAPIPAMSNVLGCDDRTVISLIRSFRRHDCSVMIGCCLESSQARFWGRRFGLFSSGKPTWTGGLYDSGAAARRDSRTRPTTKRTEGGGHCVPLWGLSRNRAARFGPARRTGPLEAGAWRGAEAADRRRSAFPRAADRERPPQGAHRPDDREAVPG